MFEPRQQPLRGEAIQSPSPILLRAAFSIAAPASSIPAHQRDDQFAEIAATLTKAAPDVVLYVSNAATRVRSYKWQDPGSSTITCGIMGLYTASVYSAMSRSL
jgi:hypothetical protein